MPLFPTLNTKPALDEMALRSESLTLGTLILTMSGQYIWRNLEVKLVVVGTGRQNGTYTRLSTDSIGRT